MRTALFTLLLATGCEKDLLENMHDAGPDAELAIDAQGRCMAPMTDAHAAATYTLYVNFDGVTLSPCSQPSAMLNCTDIVPGDTTFPPFLDGNPARDGYIATILTDVSKGLAPYSIDIVTTRPASGDYYMSVVGGSSALVNGPPGNLGVAGAGCSAMNRNLVDLVFDFGLQLTQYDYANTILSNLAMSVGLPITTGPKNDCACRSCPSDNNRICSFGVDSPVTTDPMHSCGLTTADEPALLQAALGCR